MGVDGLNVAAIQEYLMYRLKFLRERKTTAIGDLLGLLVLGLCIAQCHAVGPSMQELLSRLCHGLTWMLTAILRVCQLSGGLGTLETRICSWEDQPSVVEYGKVLGSLLVVTRQVMVEGLEGFCFE
ncbi:hypothetical protein N657DRAFT_343018 [Parathielavia appendiculata]|uniref:Uncharacterized protein n=1 Tax=Parathielavia appendiculata TaxID=2587402 RepID=A0AAN6Z462_9PEZI|nr:hypothetical protein N657DRAFT_343018 [Parathielavia appendiculata]